MVALCFMFRLCFIFALVSKGARQIFASIRGLINYLPRAHVGNSPCIHCRCPMINQGTHKLSPPTPAWVNIPAYIADAL